MSEQHTLPALPVQEGVEFRHCPGFPGYCVGDDGSVWSYKAGNVACPRPSRPAARWKLLRGKRNRLGYIVAGMRNNAGYFYKTVSRLVLEAFIGPCPGGMEACHFPDRSPANNALCNLRWATKKDNAADSRIHGTWCHGTNHYAAKLDEEKVRRIRQLWASGLATKTELGLMFGVHDTNIAAIVMRRSWKHID